MSQLPQRPSTPTEKSLLQKTRLRPLTPSCRGRNKEQLPQERRPQLFPLLQGQLKSALTGFLGTENKRASRSSCHSTASFLNVKNSPDRKTHLGSAVIQDLLRGKEIFPMQENSCNVQHGCSTFTCNESDHRDNELLE